jgi:hypothetical protein
LVENLVELRLSQLRDYKITRDTRCAGRAGLAGLTFRTRRSVVAAASLTKRELLCTHQSATSAGARVTARTSSATAPAGHLDSKSLRDRG